MLRSEQHQQDSESLLSSLETASQNWIRFDFSGKQQHWDLTTSQNSKAREQSQAARKQLAETTKQFKRSVKTVEQAGISLSTSNSPENAMATVKAIETLAKNCRLTVRAYQEEIDNLTRRCKSSESAFGTLAQSLGDVPDPGTVLSSALEQLSLQQSEITELRQSVEILESQNAALEKISMEKAKEVSSTSKGDKEELIQLRREVAEYEVEFRSLKNQDITIRKLETRILELEKGGQDELQEKIESAKAELAETEGRRTAEALEREAAMERRAQTLELQLKAEKAGRAATQAHLLEASEGSGEREAAWEAQRRILVEDAERLRENLHEASRERDELRLKVAALDGDSKLVAPSPSSGGIQVADLLSERTAYQAELESLSHTVNSLREEVCVKDQSLDDERRFFQSKSDTMKKTIANLESTLLSVKAQLAEAPSQSLVDSMKRELRILKRLEYNVDESMGDSGTDPEMTGVEQVDADLESILVAKLRRVESEVVRERNHRNEILDTVSQLETKISELEEAKAEAEKVISTLEQDLDKAISSAPSPSSTKSTKPVVVSSNPATLQYVLDPKTPAPPANPPPAPVPTKSIAAAAEKAADDHSVATIIMAQRDRLRIRCEALEAERDSFKRELQAQVGATESLKADNTKLFEKLRYLQSYNNISNTATNTRAYTRGSSRDLDLEALEQRYEASVDPFRQFSRAERQRKVREMSPMERTVFVVAKTFLGSKEMRTFLFFYVISLHLLVFMTTYHWSHSNSGSECLAAHEHLAHLPPHVAQKTPEEA